MSEAIACPLGKLQLKCWRNAAAPGGRGRRITSLSTTSSRPPPAKAASQPASTINSRRAARRRATASARMVSVTGDPRRLIALKTASPVAVARARSQSSSTTSNWVSGSWWMTSSVTPANTHSPARLMTNPSVRCSPRYSPRAKRAAANIFKCSVRVTRLVRFRSHQRHAGLTPDPITAVVADHGRSDGGRHDSIDREMSQRREGGRRDQGGLAREREPETLEADQEEENDVAVGCNEPRYGLLHTATLVTWKLFVQRGCNP